MAGLAFLQKINRLVSNACAFYRCVLRDITVMKPSVVLSYFGRDHVQRSVAFLSFATLETRRKLGRVSFHMDFWDRYCRRVGQPLATISLSLLTDPRVSAKVISTQSPRF